MSITVNGHFSKSSSGLIRLMCMKTLMYVVEEVYCLKLFFPLFLITQCSYLRSVLGISLPLPHTEPNLDD